MKHLFYRKQGAKDNLEIFLIFAVATVLVNRFALYLLDYPQLGGGSLHIAHMLYGGLLMLVAITLMLSFIGSRIERLSSFIGGIGFGLFIDELGKFITKDNDYFFRPTIGLIYAVFILIYLTFNFLGRSRQLNQREYELNALRQFEEVVIEDLDAVEKQRLLELLKNSNNKSPLVMELTKLLNKIEPVKTPQPNTIERSLEFLHKSYVKFWSLPIARKAISFLLVAQALIFVALVTIALFKDFNTAVGISAHKDAYANRLLIAEFISSLIASAFAVAGAYKLLSSRLEAFEYFRRSILINLLLTDFFLFTRIQFGAMPTFLLNFAILIGIRYSMYEEQRAPAKPKT